MPCTSRRVFLLTRMLMSSSSFRFRAELPGILAQRWARRKSGQLGRALAAGEVELERRWHAEVLDLVVGQPAPDPAGGQREHILQPQHIFVWCSHHEPAVRAEPYTFLTVKNAVEASDWVAILVP